MTKYKYGRRKLVFMMADSLEWTKADVAKHLVAKAPTKQGKRVKVLSQQVGGNPKIIKNWKELGEAMGVLPEDKPKKVKEMEYRLVIDRDYGGHPVLTLGIGKDKKTWSEPHRAVSHLVKVVNHLLKNK